MYKELCKWFINSFYGNFMADSSGLTTGGSIGGGMNVDHVLFKEINFSFESLQQSSKLATLTSSTPFRMAENLIGSMKGFHDVIAISNFGSSLSPPVTPIGAGAKIAGLGTSRSK